MEQTGITACQSCHLPLASQHEEAPVWSPDHASPASDAWSATLRSEAVTCAACHVREGRVAVGTEAAARGIGPHIVAHAPDLADAQTCASCHQLTWPGADVPLYDTYGEWERSAWAEAGVSCVDCHRSAQGGHGFEVAPSRAVSLLVDLSSRTVVRGGDALDVQLLLQNTGAGHAVPSGTPFGGLRLVAEVHPPSGEPLEGAFRADLARTLEAAPPWATTEDTRLQAGESRSWPWSVPLGPDQPPGTWELVVRLVPTLYGEPSGPAVLEQRHSLTVQ